LWEIVHAAHRSASDGKMHKYQSSYQKTWKSASAGADLGDVRLPGAPSQAHVGVAVAIADPSLFLHDFMRILHVLSTANWLRLLSSAFEHRLVLQLTCGVIRSRSGSGPNPRPWSTWGNPALGVHFYVSEGHLHRLRSSSRGTSLYEDLLDTCDTAVESAVQVREVADVDPV
jgi:hypothetical protein